MMNVHAVLAAKGAIPNVRLSGVEGRGIQTLLWGFCSLTVIGFLESSSHWVIGFIKITCSEKTEMEIKKAAGSNVVNHHSY